MQFPCLPLKFISYPIKKWNTFFHALISPFTTHIFLVFDLIRILSHNALRYKDLNNLN